MILCSKTLSLKFTSFAALIAAWEILARFADRSIIPPPSQCAAAFYELVGRNILLPAAAASLQRITVGLFLGILFGVLLGTGIGMVNKLRDALIAPFELLRPIPPIAWIPVAIALFGINNPSAYFVIFVGAFFPILTNTEFGIREVPTRLLEVARVVGASPWQRFRSVYWPSALPSIFTGARIGLGFGWMCVVAAEMVAVRSGLGYQIQLDRQLLRLDRVIAGMFAIGLIGFLMNRTLFAVEWAVLPWRRKILRGLTLSRSASIKQLTPPATTHRVRAASQVKTNQSPVPGLVASSSRGASLSVHGLAFGYRANAPVLRRVDLVVPSGELLCFLGPSGCGKTTLLRLIAGLEQPWCGEILVDKQPLASNHHKIGMVFQDLGLFPWRTALQNVVYGLEIRGIPRSTKLCRGKSLMALMGLSSRTTAYPGELSGGQQQRVALARALAIEPQVLLLDEPFSGLDGPTRQALQCDTTQMFRERGVTVVLVTHDIDEAAFMADRVLVMHDDPEKPWAECAFEGRVPLSESRYSGEIQRRCARLWSIVNSQGSLQSKFGVDA